MKTTRKTNHLFLLLLLITVLTGCSRYANIRSKLVEELNNSCEFETLMLRTGEDIVLPIEPLASHESEILGGGSSLDRGVVCTNLPFHFNGVHLIQCTGCDSCMQCYADYGLIKYNVKKRTDTQVTADIELTAKGKRYLLYNMSEEIMSKKKSGNAEYITSAEENNIYYPVLSYNTVGKTKVLQRLDKSEYFCKSEEQEHITPFLEALGVKKSEAKTTEKKFCFTYHVVKIDGETEVSTDFRSLEDYLSSSEDYDLDEYKSLKNVLKAKFNLSDTLATFSMVEYSDLIEEEFIAEADSLPNWFQKSIIEVDREEYDNPKFYMLGSSYTLDKIIDTYNWKWSDTEEKKNYNIDLYMKEVLFKVTRHCSPYDKYINDFQSDKVTYYCRCPYIEIDNAVYFPQGNGLWALSKKSVKKAQYGYTMLKPQPFDDIELPLTIYSSIIPLKMPFEEALDFLQQNN